jgi:two-component system response regulator HydG
LREELRSRPGFGGLVGVSPRMERVYKLIQKVALHMYPVLILGESGTGKELVARSIHFSGPRKNKAFAPVDCSSLTPTLIESELFGHVRGAFTGAQHSKQGLLESAGDGTLFLDEIGELPIDLQSKLLRALQEREIKPVGSNERIGIRARVIAATNRDLESAIRTGAFRQDLYFRLNVVQIKLPPLRERKADIPLLVNTFLEKFSDPARPIHTISEDAMRRIMSYDWPGNWKMPSSAPSPSAPAPSCTWATCLRTCNTPPPKNSRTSMNSCPLKPWSAAPSSALCRKPPETSWPPRASSA